MTPDTPASRPTPAREPEATDVRIFTAALILLGLLSLALVAAAIAWRHHQTRAASPPDQPRHLVDFQLTERSGRPIGRTHLTNRVLVVNFVFTGCAQACLDINRSLADVQRRLANQPEVLLVSITIDPRSDTPEVLRDFARRFDADPDRWLFLTGDRDAVHQLLEQSFLRKLPPGEIPGLPAPDDSNPMPSDFEHAERIALVDRHGRVREYFDGMKPRVADAVTAAVHALLTEPRP